MTHPTKKLFDPDAKTQLVWTPSYATDVRATFARAIAAQSIPPVSKNVRQLKKVTK